MAADDDVELFRQLDELANGLRAIVAAQGMTTDRNAVLFELRVLSAGGEGIS